MPLCSAPRRAFLAASLLALAGCASKPTLQAPQGTNEAHWQGRLAIKVFSTPMQAFSANFELIGKPTKGELLLSSSLGTTLARMQWDTGLATLTARGEQRSFASLQELALQATGADIPVAALFAWLQGRTEDAPGWQVDLTDLADGRIQAHHTEEVQAELKIILDR